MAWPLIERELRTAWRKRNIRRMRLWGSMICVAVTLLFLVGIGGYSKWGLWLKTLLFWGGLGIILQVPEYTVGIFAEDRRNNTLGLLFLCGIGPGELFLSKTLGSAIAAFGNLIMLYPFFAISFLGGGYSMNSFLATTCSLPIALLFVFSACVLASVMCREESTAMFTATAIAAVLSLGPFALQWTGVEVGTPGKYPNGWLAFSPAGFLLLAGSGRQLSSTEFWTGCLFSIGLSCLFLSLAAFILNRVWQDRPEVIRADSWRRRWRDLLHGNASWRRRLANRWLDRNPFVWLAGKDGWLQSLGWIAIGAVVALWIACWIFWRDKWPLLVSFYFVALLLNLVLNGVCVFSAAKTVGENRRSGGLELLLTTPLSHVDIIRGQVVAMRGQLRPLAITALVLDVLMAAGGYLTRSWNGTALAVYLTFWAALLFWTASFLFSNSFLTIWDSLVSGRPAFVALRRNGLAKSPVWIAYVIFWFSRTLRGLPGTGLASFPEGGLGEIVFASATALIALVVMVAFRNRNIEFEHKLVNEFRAIAASPLPEPSDPRFKSWKSGERFPA